MTGNSYKAKRTTDEYPIAFSDFDCYGNEITLSACGAGINSDIQYCLDKTIEITCGGQLTHNVCGFFILKSQQITAIVVIFI